MHCALGAAILCAGAQRTARAADGFDLSVPAQPQSADAASTATAANSAPATRVDTGFLGDLLSSWHAVAAQAAATQPNWASPLVTTTPLLKQRIRFDVDYQHSGNGTNTTILDGGKGLDLIVTPTNEIQIAAAPYYFRSGVAGVGPKNKGAIPSFAGWGDWTFIRIEQRLAASPESGGNYVVTAWLQIQAPTGIPQLSSDSWQYIPTIAFGKGFGKFVVQSNVGVAIPASNTAKLGHPIQTNVAFQYHVHGVFWPELEVNWTYYPDGQRGGLNQVYLTPGLILSSFSLGGGFRLTLGAGYQVAVAPAYRPKPQTPSYNHAWIFTTRLNF
ncbi:MAG: hypothetical protein J0I21_02070 [Alphaproteobacteria bacterium]|nr:hypothetical protein [Alphaproteobacteria bacterium]